MSDKDYTYINEHDVVMLVTYHAQSQLDDKGRCCGKKPLTYKRPTHRLFCSRCDRLYDPVTERQVSNNAWALRSDGTFRHEVAKGNA